MKRGLFFIMLLGIGGAGVSLADTDAEVNARKNALDVAGAFTDDGFKLRDEHWCGTLKPQDHALIAVNLYAGNQYWFAVGTTDPARKIAVNVYDETGKLLTSDHYDGGDRAAAGFSPTDSGQYFVSVDLVEGGSSSFCLIYSYKSAGRLFETRALSLYAQCRRRDMLIDRPQPYPFSSVGAARLFPVAAYVEPLELWIMVFHNDRHAAPTSLARIFRASAWAGNRSSFANPWP